MVKPPLRTKSIGFKVSEEEYARLEEAARAGSFTLGEWCRQVVLEDASGEEIKPTGTGNWGTDGTFSDIVSIAARLARVVVAEVAHHVTQRGNPRQFLLASE